MTKFTFGEYTLRPTTAADANHVESFVELDPWHRGRVEPTFFLSAEPGEEVWALEDRYGHVVFYLKTQQAVRAHIQFGPAILAADRERNRVALREGLDWLETKLFAVGFRELLFDSANPLLRASAEKRLGFEPAPDDLRKILTQPKPPATPPEALAAPATATERRGK